MELGLTTLSGLPPVGQILVACAGETIVSVDFTRERLLRLMGRRYGSVDLQPSERYAAAFQAYLDGDLVALDSLPFDTGGSPFQQSVWRSLCGIPRGQTRSYSQIAEQIGRPKAVRAVGLANSLNPISLLVPCHRVIGRSGDLTGYAGGLELKRWLLAREAL